MTRTDEAGDPGPVDDLSGLYGPDSEAWRLNREAALLLAAGPRALLLQIAHPLVAEGVDQHSAFRVDPWARLAGTLRSYLTIVYGDGPTARREIARLARLHRSIAGPVRDPLARAQTDSSRYDALDPTLSLWVHATLVDSTIVAYDAWIERLSPVRRERFYAETRPIGHAFGIPDELLPRTYDDFVAYLAAMLGPDGPIHPTPTACDLARSILRPPLGPLVPLVAGRIGLAAHAEAIAGRLARLVPPAATAWALWPSVALLPPTLRAELGLAWDPPRQLVAGWLALGIRTWRPWLPIEWRQMPRARAADRRIAAGRAAAGSGILRG
ncbi:MAG: DUF2236 domain-containing protein [Chloroflexi bacterium]|nr:DUF2236 domain-containing protein [Chloroflexota bacterium]